MIYAVHTACIVVSVVASRGDERSYWGCLAVLCTPAAAAWALAGVWNGVAISGTSALLALAMWWWRRRKRRRARGLLSRKYRHVRDAMVRTLRDRRVTRPVLVPGRAS